MGTPDFAVPCLEALAEAKRFTDGWQHELVAVVTQPDKPRGRSGKPACSPVKEAALRYEIPVYQPKRVRTEDFLTTLRGLQPDVIVVVAFGQILPQTLLDIPKYGCLNVHGSLLPAYRGAAPIQWAVINGEKTSGVTVMQMDAGIDTGDILLTKEIALSPKETGGSLFEKLSHLGAEALLEAFRRLEAGTLQPMKQGEATTAYASMLEKEMGELDFTRPAAELERLIRGLNPWPSAYTWLGEKMLKIWDADVAEPELAGAKAESEAKKTEREGNLGTVSSVGTINYVGKEGFTVICGEGALLVREVQLSGKKRMAAGDFLRGYSLQEGQRLGRE